MCCPSGRLSPAASAPACGQWHGWDHRHAAKLDGRYLELFQAWLLPMGCRYLELFQAWLFPVGWPLPRVQLGGCPFPLV